MLPQALWRWWYRRRVAEPLQEAWLSVPRCRDSRWREQEYLAVDLELSSLDHRRGEIVSIAWVAIAEGAVVLTTAEHHLVMGWESVGESAAIHHIRDCDRAGGRRPREALVRFLRAAQGRCLVFHGAAVDLAFLDRACRKFYAAPLLLPYRDTLVMEQRRLALSDNPIRTMDLRLHACRARYNLPDYPPHNALTDALATAELFIAISEKESPRKRLAANL